jgi:hypothetical protein
MPMSIDMAGQQEAAIPIADAGEAQRFDLASRTLRAVLLISSSQWLLVATFIAATGILPVAGALLVALAGIASALVLVRYFARQHRLRLSSFSDPVTGELRIPNGRLPLSRGLRLAPWLVVLCEGALIVLLSV